MSNKTYDEVLDEMESMLEVDKLQETSIATRTDSYVKKGFKIKRASLITPPRPDEEITIVEPNIDPSYNTPMEVETIQYTPVTVKTLEDRAREKKEQSHQERLRQIAKEKIDELRRKKEAEKKSSEEEERHKRDEVNLEQQRGESDDDYLLRLSTFYESSLTSKSREKSPERFQPSSSKDLRGRIKNSQRPSRFVDFKARRETTSTHRNQSQHDQHKPCGADRRVVYKEDYTSDVHKPCGAERRVILLEVSSSGNRKYKKAGTSKKPQGERGAPLTVLPEYRRKRTREYFERKKSGPCNKEPQERQEPPAKKGKYSKRSLQEIGEAPETEEEYFRWRLSCDKMPHPLSREEIFDTPYTAEFDRDDEDDLDRRYRQWKTGSTLRPFLNLEENRRHYHVLFAEDEIAREMAIITLKEAKKRIDPSIGQLRTNANSVQSTRFKILYDGKKNLDTVFLTKIINRCRETGLLVADGEGKLFPKDPTLQKKQKTEKPLWLAVVVGDIDGDVYLFQNWRDVPGEVRKILSDFRVTKLQSDITKDVLEFDRHGVELTGWADTQILYRAFLNPETTQDGTDAQAEFLGFEKFPYFPKGGRPCRFDTDFINIPSKLHSAQDIRVPFAILLRAAIDRAEKLGMELDDNILPLCHEAIDLVKSLHLTPEGKRKIGRKISDNWRPVIRQDEEERVIPHCNGLNDIKVVYEMRNARSDLFEPAFEQSKGPSKEELTKVLRNHWLKRDLPTRGMMSNNLWPTLLRQSICWNCGSDQHNLRSCPQRLDACKYPHFNTGGKPKPRPDPKNPGEFLPPRKSNVQGPHSVLMCEELHHFCTRCRKRGHHVEAHNHHGQRELVQMFKKHCHKGLLTCLPFLELIPEERHRLLYHHWTWSTSGVKLPNAFPDAAALQIPTVVRRDFEVRNVETDSKRAKDSALKFRNSREEQQDAN